MIKHLSLISLSMLSTITSNMVNATSCSNIDLDKFDDENRRQSIYSACFDGTQKDSSLDSGIFSDNHSGHHFDAEDYGYKYTGRQTGTHEEHSSGEHSEHSFDWSAYDLEKYEYDGLEMHHHDGEDEHENKHGSNEHNKDRHWDKDNYWHEYEHEYNKCMANVPAVPVPAAFWLFGSGLISLLMVLRRKI